MDNQDRYPDLGTSFNPRALWRRETFRVGPHTFTRTAPDTYTCGNVTVYHDQQDSTSWAARCGDMRTGYFWAPEYAVDRLLKSVPLLEVTS